MPVQILTADVFVPMDAARTVLTDAGFAHEDGVIVAVGSRADLTAHDALDALKAIE